ncbi:hypothetical protein SELR_01170 [Selenomonas ruminantium subsp. lactilytica TAM6421]|uniref:Uncharacterized protein n=1 Tax=Selenomonas ruminantium subsp. lactilytica (strain NBRC 103574 / TAM6421) TaxID=927704 RepID=I0GM38_SELRL|nr:hypothetical protein [Selenomonas ruminantium]BAL81825.1 hypothetical protein SELR_01170 [Selenomonas ruminantium subsp. lactilytica TAM6421]
MATDIDSKAFPSGEGGSRRLTKVIPSPPSGLVYQTFLGKIEKSSKKVLTGEANSCNIIQVADRHGNETAKQALSGRPLERSKKLRKNFKKVLDKLI